MAAKNTAQKLASTVLALTPLVSQAAWESLPSFPTPNGGYACGASQGKIFVIGGTNWKDDRKYWLDVIWVYDPEARRWEIKGKLPQPLAFPVVAETDDGIILAGGFNGKVPLKEIWRLTPSFELMRVGELKESRAAAIGGFVFQQLVVAGGFVDPATQEKMCLGVEAQRLGKAGVSTFLLPRATGLGLAGAVPVGKELFVFGGVGHDATNGLTRVKNVWAFAPETGLWRVRSDYPFPVAGAAAAPLDADHILVAGGFADEPEHASRAAFIYNVRKDTFTPTVDVPVQGLSGLVRLGDQIYFLGGEDRAKHRSDVFARISIKELLSPPK
jgi:N-acetylneuraminic acid mutarotase